MIKPLNAAVSLLALALAMPAAARAHQATPTPEATRWTLVAPGSGGVTTVRSTTPVITKQQVKIHRGITATTAGSRQLSMNRIVLPPGSTGLRHLHRDTETVIYILEGQARTLIGLNGEIVVDNQAGDFLFIPANVWHQPTNVSGKPVVAIEARADADDQSNVILAPTPSPLCNGC